MRRGLHPPPTASPVAIMITIEIPLSTRSEFVRPTSTAEADIGSVRKRSISPSFRSCAIADPENVAPNTTVWAKIPAIRNCV